MLRDEGTIDEFENFVDAAALAALSQQQGRDWLLAGQRVGERWRRALNMRSPRYETVRDTHRGDVLRHVHKNQVAWPLTEARSIACPRRTGLNGTPLGRQMMMNWQGAV
jgi:hypothetical protein